MNLQRSKPAVQRAYLGFRLIRFSFGLIVGLVCIGLGLRTDPNDSMGKANSAAQRYLGPHGNGIALALVGLFTSAFCAWMLVRTFRRLKELKAAAAAQS